MAKTSGLSKKHSPLQKVHYQQYRLENRALKNLIRRLKTRVRRNLAQDKRRDKYNARVTKAPARTGVKSKRVLPDIRPDLGAIKALKKLGIKGYDSHLI